MVIGFFFGLGNLVFASWLASQRAEKGRVDTLEREVAAINERDKHTPSASDMAELRELLGEMRGARREIDRLHDRFDKYEEAIHRVAAA